MPLRTQFFAALIVVTVAGAAGAQDQVQVRLGETGILDWRFLNPKTPRPIGTDQSLLFRNEIGSRTFVVTIPFELPAGELDTSYSTASIGADGWTHLSSTVTKVLPDLGEDGKKKLNRLEYLRVLREDVKALEPDDKTFEDLRVQVEDLLTPGHLEALYWTAACGMTPADRVRLVDGEDDPLSLRAQLKIEAELLVKRLLGTAQVADPFCLRADAESRRTSTLEWRFGKEKGSKLEIRTRGAVMKRFVESRGSLAQNALLDAIDDEIADAFEKAGTVLQMLEERRLKRAVNVAQRNCERRFLRAAATLIASYGPTSTAPFSSPILRQDIALCEPGRKPPTTAEEREDDQLAREYGQPVGDVNDVGFEVTDCSEDSKSCIARATIPPYQRAVFTRAILDRRADRIIQFSVAFFDEAEPPSNATGYAYISSSSKDELARRTAANDRTREGLSSTVPAKLNFNFGGDAGADYALPEDQVESHVRRSTGAGSLGFQYVGPFDISATLQFKKGEFGGSAETNQVQASQYQARVFGPAGTILEYGKFLFAQPSSSIAISEFGEGLRLAYKRANFGYLVRRESDNSTQTADQGDRDSYVVVGQLDASTKRLRALVLTATWGNEERTTAPEKNAECAPDKDPCIVPHTYSTFGFDTKFPLGPKTNVVVGLAAYHSVRHLRPDDRLLNSALNLSPRLNGKGDVALLTMSWSRLVEQSLLDPLAQAEPRFSLTGLLGYGSADNPSSTTVDESYLGETAGYANDQLFISTLAETKPKLGHGLANKWYAGLQYTNARWSPLFWVASAFRADSEVESMTTVVTLHKYQFIREIDPILAPGKKNAGFEADVEFLIETPKNVRWSLSGAWYRRSAAVEAVGVKHNPWVVAANISIKFNAR